MPELGTLNEIELLKTTAPNLILLLLSFKFVFQNRTVSDLEITNSSDIPDPNTIVDRKERCVNDITSPVLFIPLIRVTIIVRPKWVLLLQKRIWTSSTLSRYLVGTNIEERYINRHHFGRFSFPPWSHSSATLSNQSIQTSFDDFVTMSSSKLRCVIGCRYAPTRCC